MKRKFKNKIILFLYAALLSISLGMLTGCSAKEEISDESSSTSSLAAADASSSESPAANSEDTIAENITADDTSTENTTADNTSAENTTAENMLLTIIKGGEPEEKQATLVSGNGFSLYLPDGEWQEDGTNRWYAIVNKDVQIWVTHFENGYSMEQILDGYMAENDEFIKQENGLIYKVEIQETENGIWCLFYCYPPEAEEGWGRELPVIADTFSITPS